ncbi:MAG: phage tail family protein [Succinivibrionaceae bacterium]|nr:phage tail family protein [Succinivibrionaceae bacterium]
MIYFNGIALENIAPVDIIDVLVSPISMSPTARERPIQFGSEFVRNGGGKRTVSITFALRTNDPDNRQKQLLNISAWAASDTPGQLLLPNHDGLYLTALCTGFPEPSIRQWWESKLRITFTCFDPFWTSLTEKSVAAGSAFTPSGSAPPLTQIRGAVSARGSTSFSNGAQTMTFAQIPAGNLVIDLDKQTAAVNGVSIMQYYSLGSSFLVPRLGTQTITGIGTVYYRERWV